MHNASIMGLELDFLNINLLNDLLNIIILLLMLRL